MCSCLADPGRCCRYTPSPPLPLQELLEQSLTLAVGQRTRASCTTCVQERIKLSLHLGASIGRHLGQEFFSYAIARPARNLAGEVNLSPFGLEGRLLQLVELREVSFNEARHTTVAVTAFRPVENSQYGRHGNRRNSLASLDEIRIVLRLKSCWNVVVLELSPILDRDEVKARFGLKASKEVVWLADHMHDRRHFAAAHLLQGNGVVDEHRLDLDPEALKDNLSGEVGGATGRVERHLSTGEVLECLELLPGIDVNLGEEQRRDILNLVLDIRDLHLAPEVIQNVRLGDRDIDPTQVEQVGDVADRAEGDHRDDAKVVLVIEYLGQIGRIADKGALKQAPRDPDRPGIQICLGRVRRRTRLLRPPRSVRRSQSVIP